jgi:general L-amino acid transport system permease protein
MTETAQPHVFRPALPPPRSEVGALGWFKHNLFSSPLNSLLTIAGLWLIYKVAAALVSWAIVRAVWTGADGAACNIENAGACWPFIKAKLGLFMYGRYPDAERWRVNLTYLLAAVGLFALLTPRIPYKAWSALFVLVIFPVIAFFLLHGGVLGLPLVETQLWGGLLVTLVVASVGIVASFPLGILLALGRRSNMPIIRGVSIGFIEIVRGVPLISVLFMASVMLPLFLPPSITIDKLVRALVGVALFSAAYLAETVRGGLQAIPRGQFEAADALSLSYNQKMRLIVLPQALKLVIPGIVNSFVALFKDTSLVLIIGLFDLLGIVQQSIQGDQKWASPSTAATGYIFAGFIFWAFCFAISRYSARLEQRLNTANR